MRPFSANILAKTFAVATFAAMGFAAPAGAQSDAIVGTSSPGGGFFLIGGGLANFINDHSDTLKVTARTTGGSVENVRLLVSDQIHFALTNADVLYEARHGEGQFEGQGSDEILAVAGVANAPLHFVALSASGITSFGDLAGKRVSLGAAGSGTASRAASVMEALGLEDEINVVNLGFDESADALRDGNIEAFAGSAAPPVPAISALAQAHDIVLIDLSEEEFAKIQAASPTAARYVVPAGSYPGVDEDVLTASAANIIITHASVPEEVVYEFTKMMFRDDSKDYMKTVFPGYEASVAADFFSGIEVSFHPGAERALRELDLID